jgi:hypothetical protein
VVLQSRSPTKKNGIPTSGTGNNFDIQGRSRIRPQRFARFASIFLQFCHGSESRCMPSFESWPCCVGASSSIPGHDASRRRTARSSPHCRSKPRGVAASPGRSLSCFCAFLHHSPKPVSLTRTVPYFSVYCGSPVSKFMPRDLDA